MLQMSDASNLPALPQYLITFEAVISKTKWINAVRSAHANKNRNSIIDKRMSGTNKYK